MAAVVWTKLQEAENYSQSRPDHPEDVVNISLQFLRKHYDGELKNALDIGCGTGKSTQHLIPHFAKVYGCDPSEAMLIEARTNFEKKGLKNPKIRSSLSVLFKSFF